MLKNMEEKGLIFKKPDENDKRSVRIYLTDEGKRKKEVSRETVLRFNNVLRNNISEEKIEIFFEVIKEVNETIENNNIYATTNEQTN